MQSASSTTVEIQELLAISSEYLMLGTDAVVACRDRAIEPFGERMSADRAQQPREAVERHCA